MSSHDDPDPAATPDDVGSLAEEAEKFFGALTDWAKDAGSGATEGLGAVADQAAAAAHSVNEHLATGSADCQWCPVCRVVHAVRETSPEVRQHLAVAASSLLQAVSGMLATATPAQDRGEVERIDLDADAGDWPEDELRDELGDELGDDPRDDLQKGLLRDSEDDPGDDRHEASAADGSAVSPQQTTRKQSAQKQTPRKQTPRKQSARKQTSQKQSARKQTARKQSTQKQTPRKQAGKRPDGPSGKQSQKDTGTAEEDAGDD